MAPGCCGGNYMTEMQAPSMPYGGATPDLEYSLRSQSRTLDLGKHDMMNMNPNTHAHTGDFYKPKASMPYTRAEDAQTGNILNQAAEKNASVAQKYGAGQARMLYWNVSGI